jgi:hypothetical protein
MVLWLTASLFSSKAPETWLRELIILILISIVASIYQTCLLPTPHHQQPTMKFLLLILSITVMITGSSAVAVDTTNNRQLQWNPNCNTLALWHPNYNTGWAGGFCSQIITCNSPSYDSAADCCKFAYAGQSSNTCYTTAGIPIPTSAPVPGMAAAGTWYPNYPTDQETEQSSNIHSSSKPVDHGHEGRILHDCRLADQPCGFFRPCCSESCCFFCAIL